MIRIEENPTNLLRKILTQAIRQKLRNDIEPFVLVYCANGSVTPAHIAQILQLYTENFGNNMVMKLGISCCDICFLLHLCILLGKKIKIQKEIVTLIMILIYRISYYSNGRQLPTDFPK